MTLTNDTQKKIAEFAQKQSRYYLDHASMTYWEKAQAKVDKTKRKAERKAAKFKAHSEAAQTAQNDLTVYMSDFIEDLISQGVSEEEAFRRACEELAHDSGTSYADDLYERYAEDFYNQYNPFVYAGEFGGEQMDTLMSPATGMYYAGSVLIGLVLGALVGVIVGFMFFPELFWVGAVVGLVLGAVLGVGVALILHGRALAKMR